MKCFLAATEFKYNQTHKIGIQIANGQDRDFSSIVGLYKPHVNNVLTITKRGVSKSIECILGRILSSSWSLQHFAVVLPKIQNPDRVGVGREKGWVTFVVSFLYT